MSRVSWSSTITRSLDVVVGISMLAVYVSLSHAWFSARWPGNYEFYAGNEDAFGARGYPVQIAIRLIVVICLATVALLLLSAALRVSEWRLAG